MRRKNFDHQAAKNPVHHLNYCIFGAFFHTYTCSMAKHDMSQNPAHWKRRERAEVKLNRISCEPNVSDWP